LRPDESVLLFPTAARLAPGGTRWVLPLEGWVHEPEEDARVRGAFLHGLAKGFGFRDDANARFHERARLFLADNESGKRVVILLGDGSRTSPRSGSDGRFALEAVLSSSAAAALADADGWVRFAAVAPDGRLFPGESRLVKPTGLSVIADIDDTLKISNVRDKPALLSNVFSEVYQPVPGMAGLLSRWTRDGAAVHYVSASPWPLFKPLRDFLAENGFPRGSFHLKRISGKKAGPRSLLTPPEKHKIPVVEAILRQFPERRFYLLGDSGEGDPEIYGELARRHGARIEKIFIRRAGPEDATERLGKAFRGLPPERWTFFTSTEELD